jgi:glyoxylase-like metal-dependent hydrolase (beta-lactamase superfamily II)
MSEDIPFDKNLDLNPDVVDEPMPGVRRIMANNPGPFTFKGTVSYIIGRGKVAIVDPGPDDPAHIGALLDAVRNETVTHIFVTHTHRDHSPAVRAIKKATGATVFAEGPHRAARPLHIGELNPLDVSADRNFRPDARARWRQCPVMVGRLSGYDAGNTANHKHALEKTLSRATT